MGIGMTIYFRQMKFFSVVFTILTFISVPSFVLFSLGKSPSGQGLWFTLSLGNLGYEDLACSHAKVDETDFINLNIECEVGNIAAMLDFGLSTKESGCPAPGADNILEMESVFTKLATDPQCNLASLDKAYVPYVKLSQQFQTCFGQPSCSLSINKTLVFSPDCISKMESDVSTYNGTLYEPDIFLLAQCDNLQLFNPLSGRQSTMTRQEVGSLLAFLDVICVLVFVLANIFQHRISEATVEEFKDISLQVSDFSIEVEDLPPLADYKNQHILKAVLWEYFHKVAAAQPQVIEEMKKTQKYESEVVDVFFGHKHLESLDLLSEIKERQK